MNGGERGVVGGIVGRWIEAYERALGREKELKEQLRKIDLLLEEVKKAKYLIDASKLQEQKREYEEKLKAVQQKRLKLEWLAVEKIKGDAWSPEILKEYSFVQDLLLLEKIREEQIREICQNCYECRLVRVRTTDGKEVPLETVTKPNKACSLPYIPHYSLKEIWETKKQLQMKVKPLGPLTPEEKEKVEKWISQRLVLYRNLVNAFVEEKRKILSRRLLKTGCTRKLSRLLPIREKEIRGEDWNPKVPDHFSEDIVAEIGEDGSYSRIYISAKHGSEESE
jgi:type I site-specific restriction-modification system R (restriction) subunit